MTMMSRRGWPRRPATYALVSATALLAASLALPACTGTAGPTSQAPARRPATTGVIPTPTVPQSAGPNDIVGFNVQNTTSAAVGPRYVSFGQPFVQGKVPATAQLLARFGSAPARTQMDIKTRYPDGSVRFAVITLQTPQLTAGATTGGMLLLGDTAAAAVDLGVKLAGYSLTLALSGGMTKTVMAKSAISAALASSAATYWRRGPNATEARVDVPVSGSLHAVFDVTAYADGTYSTDVMLNNDYAMQPVGGTVSYSAVITQGGEQKFASGTLTHYQYQQWHEVVWSTDAPPINVQHDVPYLIKAGVFQNYDTTIGINPAVIPAASYQPLGDAGITRYMPMVGDRQDIGATTNVNALCLLSQDTAACRASRAQADAAASVPWHFFDPKRGDYVSLDDYPTLWADGRGKPKLTQPVAEPTWTTDTAHQPGLSLVPYVLWGKRFDLDQINAQATFSELATWNVYRHDGQGIVLNDSDQQRAQGWMLRQLDDAAWANPDGSKAKAYWQRLEANSLGYQLDTLIPAYQAQTEFAGFVFGPYNGQALGGFMQDFIVSSVATAAIRGNAQARQLLQAMANYQVGRFRHGLASAVGYMTHVGDGTKLYPTWAQYVSANGTSDALPTDGGYWVPLGLETLANFYNVLGLRDALDLYNLVKGKNAPGTDAASFQGAYAKFHVVPAASTVAVRQPRSGGQ
jgi:hypothetical protein